MMYNVSRAKKAGATPARIARGSQQQTQSRRNEIADCLGGCLLPVIQPNPGALTEMWILLGPVPIHCSRQSTLRFCCPSGGRIV